MVRLVVAAVIVALGLLAVATYTPQVLPVTMQRSTLYPLRHADLIAESAARHGVDPYLVCAVIDSESDWDESASSTAGAQGLMQLMPSTAAEVAEMGLVDSGSYDPKNLLDPATNIEYGCAYLGWLSKNSNSPEQIIAAYNAGPGVVEQWLADGSEDDDVAGLVRYPETRHYLSKVKRAYDEYRSLYPEGIA